MIEDRPVLFDAIEFDEAIATCDVLYDLGFLLMDLWTRKLRSHANLLFNRYLWICDDVERQLKGLSLLPLFLSLRAAIRAKVTILQPGTNGDHAKDARRYFEAACGLLAPRRLDLVAIGGLSGTGKSSLSAALAGSIGRAPGAVHLRSDIERKRLFDVHEFDRLPGEAYRPEATARTYQRLRDLAATALDAGQSVVIDAVHLRPEERVAVKQVASRSKAHFTGLWLEGPINTLMEPIAKRKTDASDATADVVSAQAKQPTGAVDWLRDVAASRPNVAEHAESLKDEHDHAETSPKQEAIERVLQVVDEGIRLLQRRSRWPYLGDDLLVDHFVEARQRTTGLCARHDKEGPDTPQPQTRFPGG